jgi:hypothetical protein
MVVVGMPGIPEKPCPLVHVACSCRCLGRAVEDAPISA